MRKRKRAETHTVQCFKYRAYILDQESNHMLPEAVYAVARKMQDVWNTIAQHNADAYVAWKVGKKEDEKPGKDFYKANDEWATQYVKDAALPDELGTKILDRLHATFKRMKTGGGAPKPHYRMETFSLHHRYTGGGMAISKLGGLRAERFRVVLPESNVYMTNARAARRARTVPASFRVGSTSVNLALNMHRSLPANGFIKSVALCGKKPSRTLEWEFYIVLSVEIEKPQRKTGARTIAIDVGWRKLEDSLRVAFTYDGSTHRQLTLPLKFVSKGLGKVSLDRLSNIKNVRDTLLEGTKRKLVGMGITLPAQARNGALIRLLRDPEQPENVRIFLESWKKDNDYYLRLERLVENKLMSHRDHIYKNFAHEIAQHYDKVHIEKIDLKSMWAVEATRDDPALKAAAERRKLAACGYLLSYIKQAVAKAGGEISEIPAEHTTDVCAVCGADFYSEGELVGRCSNGHQRDQDLNAAENLFHANMGLSEAASTSA